MVYNVKLSVFEGPLDLLLELIEKRKLAINQVSLAAVTDDFLNYVKTLTELKLGDISYFVVVAATLILIKSKSLLPTMELSPEEESSIAELEERLRKYQVIKTAIPNLKNLFGRQVIFNRTSVPFVPIFAPDPNLTVDLLQKTLLRLLAEMPRREFLAEASVSQVISLEEMMKNLISRIEKNVKLNFEDLTRGEFKTQREKKIHLVVSFLALLELFRQGLIKIFQTDHFEEIRIEKTLT